MKFNSQICTTREQSERLLALGVKKETADMYFSNAGIPVFNNGEYTLYAKSYTDVVEKLNNQISSFDFIPAWSLHRLIVMMPQMIKREGKECRLRLNALKVEYTHPIPNGLEWPKLISIVPRLDTCYDAIILVIEWLIKEGYFNKEYLNE